MDNSIVLDLQNAAMNKDEDITSILRKAHVIARKLKLVEFDELILAELNGYNNESIMPNYRMTSGELKGWNPYHGWIPVIIDNNEIHQMICNRKLYNSLMDWILRQ